jgi:hypothetical protein
LGQVRLSKVRLGWVTHQVLNKVDGQGGHDDVEVLEVGVLVAVELLVEHIDQKLKEKNG